MDGSSFNLDSLILIDNNFRKIASIHTLYLYDDLTNIWTILHLEITKAETMFVSPTHSQTNKS